MYSYPRERFIERGKAFFPLAKFVPVRVLKHLVRAACVLMLM